MSAAPRKHRRVVAPPTRVGPDEPATPQVSRTPSWTEHPSRAAGTTPGARRDRQPVVPDRAAEDTDAAWGQSAPDSNDARLLEGKPPHW